MPKPIIIPRAKHNVTRANISPNALKVLYRLRDAGFSAYLVGGSVRDLVLEGHPKDFDIATNAHPEQIKPLFRSCILIGRRFRLAHVRFGREVIEVATFRAAQATNKKTPEQHHSQQGMLLRDNVYGTLVEDAWRRDFTINALYYNIADFSIVDYCGGMIDLQQKILRIIGDPIQRYHEDPVRLLRVIRFAGKLNFQIAPETEAPIKELARLLAHVPAARLFDEVLKLFHSGKALPTLQLLRRYHLLEQLFPQVVICLANIPATEVLLNLACNTTDERINEGKHVSPAYLFACLLWYPLQERTQKIAKNHPPVAALHIAAHEVLSAQTKLISIPRRFTTAIKEIWDLQGRLQRRNVGQVFPLLEHPRFRAAYDFLLLRVAAGEDLKQIADWWTEIQSAGEARRQELLKKLPKTRKRRRSKSRPKQES